MPRFFSPRSQQNRPLPQAQPMQQARPIGASPYTGPQQTALGDVSSMGPQQTAQQAPSMSQGPQQTAMPQGGMGLMGAPQQGAPLGAGAGFGAPATQSQAVNNAMRGTNMKKGGAVKKMASGGTTSSASKRADGIAQKGKTKGRMC